MSITKYILPALALTNMVFADSGKSPITATVNPQRR